MIDIPNLVAGAVLGFLLSLPFSIHERQERKREVGITWTKDLRRAERLIADPKSKAQDVYEYFSNIPTDHYRRVLGPGDFRLVEDLQNAYWGIEYAKAEVDKARTAVTEPLSDGMQLQPLPGESSRETVDRHVRKIDAALAADTAHERAWKNYGDARQTLHDLRVAVMNRGRERSRDEYGDLIGRERRADRWRHPIRWLIVEYKNWRRRRQDAKEIRAEQAPNQ